MQCLHRLRLIDGILSAENRDGGGARFTISLPVHVTDGDGVDASV